MEEDANIVVAPSSWRRAAPGLALVLIAPLVAEVLPGATRLRAMFVFPIEVCVWGGGALLIRDAVRRGRLGWFNMLLLALALAVAEECLIQQTSLAPMVIRIKGQTYARAFGVNYVYLLWALVYETVFVVFLPVSLVELIFSHRREEPWVGTAGVVAAACFFLIGSCLAWFTWTRIARLQVFHVPAYTPPPAAILAAFVAIVVLVFLALGPVRHALAAPSAPLGPPAPWVVGTLGALWAVLWYALVVLAFGIAPAFPPSAAVAAGLALALGVLFVVPRWSADARWRAGHSFAVVFGTMLGSMAAGFVAFIGAARADLVFKIAVDVLAAVFMIVLGFGVRRRANRPM